MSTRNKPKSRSSSRAGRSDSQRRRSKPRSSRRPPKDRSDQAQSTTSSESQQQQQQQQPDQSQSQPLTYTESTPGNSLPVPDGQPEVDKQLLQHQHQHSHAHHPLLHDTHGRHFAVVGGDTTLPSLREVVRHRNHPTRPAHSTQRRRPSGGPRAQRAQQQQQQQQQQPQQQQQQQQNLQRIGVKGQSFEKATFGQLGVDTVACKFCQKVSQVWQESDGLRTPTSVTDVELRATDGQEFYCNSFVLLAWSEALLDEAQCVQGENDQECWVADVPVSGAVLATILRFMYGGTLRHLVPDHLNSITNFADYYKIDDLKKACFDAAAVATMNVQSACVIWHYAHQNHLVDTERRVMRFVYENLKTIVKDALWNLVAQPRYLLELFYASASWTKSVEVPMAPVPVEQGRIGEMLLALWQESDHLTKPCSYSDVIITTKEGHRFHLHKQLLFAVSPAFANWLTEECVANDAFEVFIEDVDGDVVEEFLRAVYQQPPSTAFDELAEMVYILATDYDVKPLIYRCEQKMSIQQVTTAEAAVQKLREADEHRMHTMKRVCFEYLYDHAEEVRHCEDWQRLVFDEPPLLVDMIVDSKRFRQLKASID